MTGPPAPKEYITVVSGSAGLRPRFKFTPILPLRTFVRVSAPPSSSRPTEVHFRVHW